MSNPAQGTDMISLLVQDHNEVKQLFSQIEAAQDATTRRELADTATTELVKHSVAEEVHLYPTARKVLPGGDALADREVEEHGAVERLLKRWEGMDGDDPEFMTVFREVSTNVLQHVQEEEGELFPLLQQRCSTEDLQELGTAIETTKKTAPTRPHPSAPDSPGALRALAPGAGLVDRIRDLMSGRGRSAD